MVKTPKPCIREGCGRPKWSGQHTCYWHKLLTLPIEDQILNAQNRLEVAQAAEGFELRKRVPEREWPDGERWCSGCQSFIPMFYCQGSRCRACSSKANHTGMIGRVYGLTREEFEALYEYQGGRCYICQRRMHSKRPAVDHDHTTGEVRGLLCADSDRGCNHAILGNIRSVEMAQRIVDYLVDPPFRRLQRQGLAPVTGAGVVGPPGVDRIESPF